MPVEFEVWPEGTLVEYTGNGSEVEKYAGRTGVLTKDQNVDSDGNPSVWVSVKWDESTDGYPPDGTYFTKVLTFSTPKSEEVAKADLTTAIAALVDKTYEEAYAKGLADGTADPQVIVQPALTDLDKGELQELFTELTVTSGKVYNFLSDKGIV